MNTKTANDEDATSGGDKNEVYISEIIYYMYPGARPYKKETCNCLFTREERHYNKRKPQYFSKTTTLAHDFMEEKKNVLYVYTYGDIKTAGAADPDDVANAAKAAKAAQLKAALADYAARNEAAKADYAKKLAKFVRVAAEGGNVGQ